jgi:hypothetical protein
MGYSIVMLGFAILFTPRGNLRGYLCWPLHPAKRTHERVAMCPEPLSEPIAFLVEDVKRAAKVKDPDVAMPKMADFGEDGVRDRIQWLGKIRNGLRNIGNPPCPHAASISTMHP